MKAPAALLLFLGLLAAVEMETLAVFPCKVASEQRQAQQSADERCGFAQSSTYRVVEAAVDFIDRRHDFVTAAATIVIALFTATLWRATDRLWKEGIAAREHAKDIFVATERPWLDLDIEVASDMVWNEFGARIDTKTTITNVGRAVATNVYLIQKMVLVPLGKSNIDLWGDLMAEGSQHKFEGEIIFPGKCQEKMWSFDLSHGAISAVFEKNMMNPAFFPWLLGSVSYSNAVDPGTAHKTAVRLRLDRVAGTKRFERDQARIPASEMRLVRPDRGCIRAD